MFEFKGLIVNRASVFPRLVLVGALFLAGCMALAKKPLLEDGTTTDPSLMAVKIPSSSRSLSQGGLVTFDAAFDVEQATVSSIDKPVSPTGTPVVDEPIPTIAGSTAFLMSPSDEEAPLLATYTVTMTQAPVSEVLFALARDAELNVDIYSGITDKISINAVNQTLPAILDRITEQANLKYKIKGSTIIITPDKPFRRNYQLDYIPAKRTITSEMSVSTHVDSAGAGNNSQVNLKGSSEVDFWSDLVENISNIIGLPEDKDTVPVIWNRATGIINVLATNRQHKQVQAFFDRVMRTAMRQVFIEATVVSIQLSDEYQAGVDWSLLTPEGKANPNNRLNILGNRISSAPNLALQFIQEDVPFLSGVLGIRDLTATVRMLSQFGNAKVVSTPKITVLNNQTAVLRVTTNEVYFRIKVTPSTISESGGVKVETPATTETQSVTVPIGFIMQVTPQIDENEVITMNIRPTLQRISKWVDNPDPNMRANLGSMAFTPPQVPVVQVQEMDSILRVPNGQVAVMGGLMEDSFVKDMDGVPYLSTLPFVGSLFSYRKDDRIKKELLIFLRPVIINDANDMYKVSHQDVYSARRNPIDNYWGPKGAAVP